MLLVLVKTDLNTEPRHRGMSLLIVEKERGYRATKLEKLGYRGVDTGEVQFEDVRVPAANLVGDAQGRGLQQILSGLALGSHQRRRAWGGCGARVSGCIGALRTGTPDVWATDLPSTRPSRSSSPTWQPAWKQPGC